MKKQRKKPRSKTKLVVPTSRPRTNRKTTPKLKELHLEDLKEILGRAKGVLSAEDHEKLESAVDTLAWLTGELESKDVSLKRLKKLLFGSSSEKTKDVVGSQKEGSDSPEDTNSSSESSGNEKDTAEQSGQRDDDSVEGTQKGKRKGHGRRGADEYTGAKKVTVDHESLKHGDRCPSCEKGKVYRLPKPSVLVRIVGVAPLSATVYERERLRCNLCGEVFTARSPEGVGEKKYDETAATMTGLMKYGCGMPFNRLERLSGNLGIPLPAATQWDLVEEAARYLEPVWGELVHLGAQGDVVYIDDTKAKVLELNAQILADLEVGKTKRTGVFTSGVVSTINGRKLALFFTGRKHAGENLEVVLAQRSVKLSLPILMCDALSRNTSGDFEAIVANCLSHARRHFVDVVDNFPDEVRYVLETLGQVYKNDAWSREHGLTSDERLILHQEKSGPLIEELEKWLQQQFDEKKVEPNSSLGDAITYMQNHWDELTLFLRVAGAPLDNNICERALKKAILHRKNSLFYKTENGAHVGDVFMTLIHTAEFCGSNPFEYLVSIIRHHEAAAQTPSDWMPWNYTATLASRPKDD